MGMVAGRGATFIALLIHSSTVHLVVLAGLIVGGM